MTEPVFPQLDVVQQLTTVGAITTYLRNAVAVPLTQPELTQAVANANAALQVIVVHQRLEES